MEKRENSDISIKIHRYLYYRTRELILTYLLHVLEVRDHFDLLRLFWNVEPDSVDPSAEKQHHQRLKQMIAPNGNNFIAVRFKSL